MRFSNSTTSGIGPGKPTRLKPPVVPGCGLLSRLNAQLCYWARNGRLIRTASSTYKITFPDVLTPPTGP